MGHPDLSPSERGELRGLVIFPLEAARTHKRPSDWWLVVAALAVAAAMIAIAFAVR